MADTISFFRAQIQNRRFTIETLQILESILIVKDVRSALETRSEIRDLLRAETVLILREIGIRTVDEKLSVVDFLVKAFFIVGDAESCLALRYEALVLRNARFVSDPGLEVSYEEWYTFAKDSFDNGFYSIAVKGFENALMCIQSHIDKDYDYIDDDLTDHISKHRDMAEALVASHSEYHIQNNTCPFEDLPSVFFRLQLGREIWNQTKAALSSKIGDVHTRIRKKNYEEVPKWWFHVILVAMLALSIFTCEGSGNQLQFKYWVVLLVGELAFLFTLPIAVSTTTTN